MMSREKKIAKPNAPRTGGCWICHTDNGYMNESMDFCMELDTYYHTECLRETEYETLWDYEEARFHE